VKVALRVIAGAALLALVIWYVDPRTLARSLAGVNPWLFAVAVVVAILSNVFSALRWWSIARTLKLSSSIGSCLLMYARATTANMMLPGSIVSGDVLRSYQLSRIGENPLAASAWSVFLDRFSGLWILCAMSALAAAALGFWGYAAILAAAFIGPLLPIPLPRNLGSARPILVKSAWYSCVVQLIAAGTLWVCAQSIGLSVSYGVMLAAAAPIFIMAALPIGVAGFGAREAAAVAVLGFAGVPGDQAFLVGLLYGLAAVVQGILAAPLFLAKA
jgi:glycosyltransferase 2 family protein